MADSEQLLLARFIEARDPEAFRALVERHREMVFATCHRILGNAADAEDAAQECFLRLVRKARRLRAPIGGWLHRVAVGVAIDLRRQKSARGLREARAIEEKSFGRDPSWDALKRAVDEAIDGLPERLRTPMVLHYLEGRTQDDIASELRVDKSTVSRQLKRGAEALRRNLGKSGWAAPAVVLTEMLASHSSEASPQTLAASLGKMALATSATAKGAGLGALKFGIASVLAAGIVAGGVVARNAITIAPAPAQPAAVVQPAPQQRVLSGTVVLADGKPAPAAKVELFYCHDWSGYGSRVFAQTQSDNQGKFSIAVPPLEPPGAFAWLPIMRTYLIGSAPGYSAGIEETLPDKETGYQVSLESAHSQTVTLLDAAGKPVANADISLLWLSDKGREIYLDDDARVALRSRIDDAYKGKSDRNGRVTFAAIPTGLASLAVTSDGQPLDSVELDAGATSLTIRPIDEHLPAARKIIKIRGQALCADTGKPAVGFIVSGADTWPPLSFTVTDDKGIFETLAAAEDLDKPSRTPRIMDSSPKPAYLPTFIKGDASTLLTEAVTFSIRRGVPISAKVVDKKTGAPVAHAAVIVWPGGTQGNFPDCWAVTDANGELHVAAASDSVSVKVQTAGPGYVLLETLPGPGSNIEIPAKSEKPVEIAIERAPETRLDVVCRTADGAAIPNASVVVHLVQGNVSRPAGCVFFTDKSGRGRIVNLEQGAPGAPGHLWMEAHAADGHTGRAAFLALPPLTGHNGATIDLVLRPTVTVKARFVDANGQPFMGMWAAYFGDDFAGLSGSTVQGRDAEGFVQMKGFACGVKYRVRATNNGDQMKEVVWQFAETDLNPTIEMTVDPNPVREKQFKEEVEQLQSAAWRRPDSVQENLTWYALTAGVAMADSKAQTVKRFTELLGETNFTVTSIAFTKDKVWLGTTKGLFAYERKEMFWTRFAVNGEFLDTPVTDLAIGDDGILHVAVKAENGPVRQFRFDVANSKWTELQYQSTNTIPK